MSEFLLHLRSAWRFLRSVPFFLPAEQADYWTVEDAAWLKSRLNEPTGQKLLRRLNNHAHKTAQWATESSTSELAKRCGLAMGISSVLSQLESHSTISSVGTQSDKSEEAEDSYTDSASLDTEYAV